MFHSSYLETRWGQTCASEPSCRQPIEAFPFWPFPLKASDRNLASQMERRWWGWGGGSFHDVPSLWSRQINQRSSGITEVVVQPALWPHIWPHCDYPLGKGPHRTDGGVAQHWPMKQTALSSVTARNPKLRFPSVDSRPVTTIIMWNVFLSQGNGVTPRHIVYSLVLQRKNNMWEGRVIRSEGMFQTLVVYFNINISVLYGQMFLSWKRSAKRGWEWYIGKKCFSNLLFL